MTQHQIIENIEFTILTLFHATSKSELKSKIQNQDGIKTCTFTGAMNWLSNKMVLNLVTKQSILWKQDNEGHLTKPNLGIVCIQIAPMPLHIVILQCRQQIYRFKPTKSCKFTQNTTHFLPGNWKNVSCFMLLRKL